MIEVIGIPSGRFFERRWEPTDNIKTGAISKDVFASGSRIYVNGAEHKFGGHDIREMYDEQNPKFVCVSHNCIKDMSGQVVWKPPFIHDIQGDRCHLNGVSKCGHYVSMLSTSNVIGGYSDHLETPQGVVMNTQTNEYIAEKLIAPHSPRLHNDTLYISQSGTGQWGYLSEGKFIPLVDTGGFPRGFFFMEDLVYIAVSNLRGEFRRPHICVASTDGEIKHKYFLHGAREIYDLIKLT